MRANYICYILLALSNSIWAMNEYEVGELKKFFGVTYERMSIPITSKQHLVLNNLISKEKYNDLSQNTYEDGIIYKSQISLDKKKILQLAKEDAISFVIADSSDSFPPVDDHYSFLIEYGDHRVRREEGGRFIAGYVPQAFVDNIESINFPLLVKLTKLRDVLKEARADKNKIALLQEQIISSNKNFLLIWCAAKYDSKSLIFAKGFPFELINYVIKIGLSPLIFIQTREEIEEKAEKLAEDLYSVKSLDYLIGLISASKNAE